MTVERVRVSDVLRLVRRAVEPEIDRQYELIGVYSWGKGIFHRDPVIGASLGNYRYFAVEPGDLVLSNIQAWEGAIGLASTVESGAIGTHRFLTYVAVDDRIDTAWARWFFLSESGMNLIRQAAPGTTMRNRTLAIDRFENLQIPLPSLDEQRKTAETLERVRGGSRTLLKLADQSAMLIQAGQDSLVESFLASGVAAGWPVRQLADVAMVNPRPVRLDPLDPVVLVPMAAVDAATGTVMDPEAKTAGEIGTGYKQFAVGDVIFARITPCMQNGKCAVFEGPQAYGYGSTEFHVIRAGPEVKASWLHRVMRSTGFRQLAAERFKGTAGQQRVPADFLKTVRIPVPPLTEQRAAVRELDRIAAYGARLAAARARADELVASLEASAMNREFGLLT